MTDRVLVEVQDHIAQVRFNRPEKHNALDYDQFRAILEAGQSLLTRKDVRAVVLSGNGPSFCSGLDFSSFAEVPKLMQHAFAPVEGEVANNAQYVPWVWRRIPVPVIAALHGAVYGGGCQIALAADIRIAHPETKLSVMEMRWGLIPDMTGSQSLRQLVGIDVAKELTFTARVLDGREARELGLVTRLADDPLAAALKLAQEIAARSPTAMRAAKHLLDANWHADEKNGLELEARLQKAQLGSPNQMEAVMAGMQKRPAKFSDPK
ncbi:MAG: crotonase/enoyl-CoA hydratase family protein [Nevskiales bacterium]